MSTKTIVAALLITLGIVVLAYSGLTFKTPGQPIEVLGFKIETTNRHFIPPVAGALALGGNRAARGTLPPSLNGLGQKKNAALTL